MEPPKPALAGPPQTLFLLPGTRIQALAPIVGEKRILFVPETDNKLWSIRADGPAPLAELVDKNTAVAVFANSRNPQAPLAWIARRSGLEINAWCGLPPEMRHVRSPVSLWEAGTTSAIAYDDNDLWLQRASVGEIYRLQRSPLGHFDLPLEAVPLFSSDPCPPVGALLASAAPETSNDQKRQIYTFVVRVQGTFRTLQVRASSIRSQTGDSALGGITEDWSWLPEPLRMAAVAPTLLAAAGERTLCIYKTPQINSMLPQSKHTFKDIGGLARVPSYSTENDYAFVVACPSEGLIYRLKDGKQSVLSGQPGQKAWKDGGPGESRWLGPLAMAPDALSERLLVLDAIPEVSANYSHRGILRELDLKTLAVRTVWGDPTSSKRILALFDPLREPVRMAVRGNRVFLYTPTPDGLLLLRSIDLERGDTWDAIDNQVLNFFVENRPLADLALLSPFLVLSPQGAAPVVTRPWKTLPSQHLGSLKDMLGRVGLTSITGEFQFQAPPYARARLYHGKHNAVILIRAWDPRAVDLAYVDPNGTIQFATVDAEASEEGPKDITNHKGGHPPVETGDPWTSLRRVWNHLLAYSAQTSTLWIINDPSNPNGRVSKLTGMGDGSTRSWMPTQWGPEGGMDIVFATNNGLTVELGVDKRSIKI